MSIVEKALNAARRGAASAKLNDSAVGAASVVNAATAAEGRPAIVHERIHLDIDALRAAGALPPLDCERQLMEQYRRIKRPLVAFAQGGSNAVAQVSGSLIMVTSSFPAEGKTFTSLNLAINLSLEKDASVLLVDADMANPRLSTLLARRGARGLFDALGQESLDAEQLVVDTDIPGLSFLAVGTTTSESPELLASHRMASLMASLVANDPNRLVVLDSPPLLLTNESRALASVAGQVLLVVRAGVTPQESVKEATALIPDGKHVGVVLNQVDPGSSDVNYYGYGRYGAYSESSGGSNVV